LTAVNPPSGDGGARVRTITTDDRSGLAAAVALVRGWAV
jgi:hypothetical protein